MRSLAKPALVAALFAAVSSGEALAQAGKPAVRLTNQSQGQTVQPARVAAPAPAAKSCNTMLCPQFVVVTGY
ncbi:hypothetical protein [Prosthecomicrobium sp. N25]|uniref:hypothetical protein n=1 Tax=Prosthecomicrobium sp. N25 TaxID=3129254 RepID=UPI0030776986